MHMPPRVMLVALPAAAILLLTTVPASAISRSFEGRKLYTTYCLVCHGEDGSGNGPLAGRLKRRPADLTVGTRMEKRTDLELFRIIESGKTHEIVLEGMPSWGRVLPGPSIQALVSYVRFLHRSKHPLLADPEAGRVMYASYCASCHGADGRGRGTMTKILPIEPADHTDAAKMDALSNDELLKVVRDGDPGSYMPGWKNVLSEQEIRAVVSYIRLLSH